MKTWFIVGMLAVIPVRPVQARQASHTTKKHEQIATNSSPATVSPPAGRDSNTQPSKDPQQSLKVSELPSVTVNPAKRDWADWGIWAFNGLLVVVGGLQVWLLKRTFGAINRQVNLMEKQTEILRQSVDVAQKEADVALKNVQAMISSERAWIDIELCAIPKQPTNSVLDEPPNELFECAIQIQNHGRTAARIESVQIGIDTLDGPLPSEPITSKIKYIHALLGSGKDAEVGRFDANRFSEGASIVQGTKTGILRIVVQYRDVVAELKSRSTSVMYLFQRSLEDEPERISAYTKYT